MEKLILGSVIMCDDDLSSVYRKKNRYEKATVKKTLNVRETPDFDSDILCVVKPGEVFEVDNEESTRKFCKIYTSSGAEGYVVRQYVKTEVDSNG